MFVLDCNNNLLIINILIYFFNGEYNFVCHQETVQSSGGKVTSSRLNEEFDIDQCWDERVLKKLVSDLFQRLYYVIHVYVCL